MMKGKNIRWWTLLAALCRGSFSQDVNCSLCPLGSSIEDPLRQLIVQECGTVEMTLNGFLDGSSKCDEQRAVQNAEFDLSAYCCTNVTLPSACSLCGNGTLFQPDAVVPNTLETTCQNLADLADFAVRPQTCQGLQQAAPFCCELPNSCNLCDDEIMLFPDKVIPFFDGLTCQNMTDSLRLVPPDKCDDTKSIANFDVAAWCGCGSESTAICDDVCRDNFVLIDPALEIPDSNLTCGVVAELAPFLSDAAICDQFYQARFLCCEDPSYSLCPDGNVTTGPNRAISDDLDCDMLTQILSTLSVEDAKDLKLEIPLNLPSWCGCSGSEPPNICSLCRPGEQLINGDAVILNSPGLTCTTGAEFARHVKDSHFCQDEVNPAKTLCCEAIQTTAIPSAAPIAIMTVVPSEAPADDPSTPEPMPESTAYCQLRSYVAFLATAVLIMA